MRWKLVHTWCVKDIQNILASWEIVAIYPSCWVFRVCFCFSTGRIILRECFCSSQCCFVRWCRLQNWRLVSPREFLTRRPVSPPGPRTPVSEGSLSGERDAAAWSPPTLLPSAHSVTKRRGNVPKLALNMTKQIKNSGSGLWMCDIQKQIRGTVLPGIGSIKNKLSVYVMMNEFPEQVCSRTAPGLAKVLLWVASKSLIDDHRITKKVHLGIMSLSNWTIVRKTQILIHRLDLTSWWDIWRYWSDISG